MDSNPIHHPSPAKKKMKCLFLDYVYFWWSAWLIDELEPHLPPLSYQKNEMLNFRFCSTSNDQPDWSMDSNPICQPSPAKNMKCSFLYYIQLMILTRLVNGLKPHPPPLYSQKNEMLLLWITLNFWWLAGLSDGLKPHPSTPSCQKNEMLIFGLHSLLMIGWASWWTWTPSATPLQPIKWNASFWIVFTSDDQPGWLMDSNPICHPSPAKKWNATFWITFNFLWLAGLVNGLKPHPPPLSCQRNEILIFGLYSTSNDQPGLSMDLNPIHHLSPAKKWNAHIFIMFNFWWSARLVDELEPHLPPIFYYVCSQKMKCSFLYYIQLLMLARLVNELKPHLPSLSSHKNEMLIFGLHSTFDDWPGWLMDSNPIHHPSPAKKKKSSSLYYIELLMISRAGWWTRTPSATPLQEKKWNAHFWILFNFWW